MRNRLILASVTALALVGTLPTLAVTANAATPSELAGPPGACSTWTARGSYTAGNVVAYQGRTFTATTPHTLGNSARWTPSDTPQLWRPGGTCTGRIVPTKARLAPPPETWREHWFEHVQLLKLVAYNDTVAIYFDDDVNRDAAKWLTPYLTSLWQYTQQVYGGDNLLRSDRLYSIHHENKYFGGHPSTVYDASHDYRNVSDVGGNNWQSIQHEVVTHEAGHVVEIIGSGKHGSPGFGLWLDSKWLEFYIYDAYVALGLTAEAQAFYNRMQNNRDDFPRANTYWFRDWFYPLWRDHGRAQVMAKFFQLLGRYFPTRPHDSHQDFTRDLNWGEFVHFMSGAAGTNLKPLATQAFGWPASRETEFQRARQAFPEVKY